MADNITLGSMSGGDTCAADDVSGVKFQRVKITWGVDGVASDTTKAGAELPSQNVPRVIVVSASALTRPANTTAYTALDAISNNATAGSVTPTSFTISDLNDAPVVLDRMRVATTDTGLAASKTIRAYLYRSDPSASTGIVGGDNAAFSTKQGTFIGAMVGTFIAFSDGGVAELTVEKGSQIKTVPTSGAATIFALFQAVDAFTPSANSTTLTATLEGYQGRA